MTLVIIWLLMAGSLSAWFPDAASRGAGAGEQGKRMSGGAALYFCNQIMWT
jgi:hypothetical protein